MVGMKMGYWGGYGRHDEQGWRKGPWTPDEDKLLTDYVKLHGDGRWSSVYKCTGLKRSGKSCRLRWVNYLRPGLKRGQLTPQEEGIIIELHSLWGNKWSTIASYLPGRTDNEIKNYWRTHFKKRTSPSSSSSSSPGKKRRSSATVVAAQTDDDDDRDNSQLQQQMVQVDHQVTEQEQNIPACDVNNQWPPPPHGQYQLVPAAFGSGPIVEDWLWSGLWNFDDVVR